MKKFLVFLLIFVLSLSIASVAFAADGDLKVTIAGTDATISGNNITWETENKYQQVEIIIEGIDDSYGWEILQGSEIVVTKSEIAKSYLKNLESGENSFELRIYNSSNELVKTYTLVVTNKGESGGDVFWERWGQLILVLIFIVAFLLTIFFRYRRKQKQLARQAQQRTHK